MIGEQVSHYRLEEKLGEGTYGVVYRACHVEDPELMVAVKVVHPVLARDPDFLRALRRECRHLNRLQHPGIVGFRDLVLSHGSPAMVLELLEGEDLHVRLQRGPMVSDAVRDVLEQALAALAHAHEEGVVHRDIKPANLFLTRRGRLKIMDFGVARAADGSQATKSGTITGTVDYVSPEVWLGQGLTPAADVYAMGLVAWTLLVGQSPAPEGPLPQKMGWHLGVGPPDVRTVQPSCPAWLAEAVAGLTAREMDVRPADGGAALSLVRRLHGSGVAPATMGVTKFASTADVPGKRRVIERPATVSLQPTHEVTPRPPPSPSPDKGTVAITPPAPSVSPESEDLAAAVEPPPPLAPERRSVRPIAAGIAALAVIGVGGLAILGGVGSLMMRTELPREGSVSSLPEKETEPLHRQHGYRFVEIPAGTFTMGCTPGFAGAGGGCNPDETRMAQVTAGDPNNYVGDGSEKVYKLWPPIQVEISRPFLLGSTEVTQRLYQAVVGDNPSLITDCPECPVDNVGWIDAIRFANALSEAEDLQPVYTIPVGLTGHSSMEGLSHSWRGEDDAWGSSGEDAVPQVTWDRSADGYRLPTEAEWEYAARAGMDTPYSGSRDPLDVAWVAENSEGSSHPVGQKKPNPWGLYDMSGNVWEWVWDIFAPYANAHPVRIALDLPGAALMAEWEEKGFVTDPAGLDSIYWTDAAGFEGVPYGQEHIYRGGAYLHPAPSVFVSSRQMGQGVYWYSVSGDSPTPDSTTVDPTYDYAQGLRLARSVNPSSPGE